jgi:mono/diheme cytochrome c family protein
LAFAQAHCSGCHAVAKGQISPNPEAPSFEAVVNAPDVTSATLAPWLRDSHNFPQMMRFSIAPDQIDDLAAYMLTLQNPDFHPPI